MNAAAEVAETVTLEEFEARVRAHDLAYSYSDDHSVWQRGSRDRGEIETLARLLPREDVVRIWNAVADEKLLKPYNEQFHWKTNPGGVKP